LGVLIEGGSLPGDVESHFTTLIEKSVIRRLTT
jgi:hypothetical protein